MEQENELKVILKSKELNKYTILKTDSSKFPKRYTFTFRVRLQNKSMNIYEMLMDANKTNLNTNRKRRIDLQSKVINECDKFLYYIELLLDFKIIADKSAAYWSKLVSDVKYMTIAWRTKDKNS